MCSWTDTKSKGETPPELKNVPGDCEVIQCNGDGQTETLGMQLDDMFSYGNPCFKDDCGGGINRPPVSAGATCPSGGYCNKEGRCMECASKSHCPMTEDCDDGICAPMQCFNATQDAPSETGIDCGGPCGPCNTNAGCKVKEDCKSGVCIGNTCLAPDCFDFQWNGDETDVDCGGACMKKCASMDGCLIHADCTSGECVSGKCK
jgi:hypothetical protein